jgi:hypothetical protein
MTFRYRFGTALAVVAGFVLGAALTIAGGLALSFFLYLMEPRHNDAGLEAFVFMGTCLLAPFGGLAGAVLARDRRRASHPGGE